MELFCIGLWLISTLLTIQIYQQRGHSVGFGILVGVLLGPLGVVVALTKPDVSQ
jgi:hypothetical protein